MRGDLIDNVLQSFHISVTQKPNAIAVRSASHCLSYAELDAQSDALRGRIAAAAAGRGGFAGILLDRSVPVIVSFLAVLKAGGAFVPLDPASPPQSHPRYHLAAQIGVRRFERRDAAALSATRVRWQR